MVTHLWMPNKQASRIFFWPTVVAILSLYGLVSALLIDDDIRELLSDAAVAIPAVVAAYYYWLKPMRLLTRGR